MSRVTLRDIANAASVSVSTVSIALSGRGVVSEHQRERIRELADKMGYVPNPTLAALASKRFRNSRDAVGTLVALVEFPLDKDTVSVGQHRPGLLEACKQLGYQPQVYPSSEIGRYSDLAQRFYRCGVEGVVFTGPMPEGFFADPEPWRRFALIQCGRFRKPAAIHTVRADMFSAIRICYEQLKALGYQRIGFAFGCHDPVILDDKSRIGAVYGYLHLDGEAEHFVTPFQGRLDDRNAFLGWLKKEAPDVVVGLNNLHYYLLLEAGWKVPEAMGFAAIMVNPSVANEGGEVQVSGLNQNTHIIAQQSIYLLDQLIRHHQTGFPKLPRETLIPPTWEDGVTLRTN